MKKQNQKGFTLAELLIVVAIIAVLVAIAIPVFTKRLEASRETTDIANLRAAYAAAQVAALSNEFGSTTEWWFDPNSATGLVSGGAPAAAKMGKGTTYDGGTDTNSMPKVCTYSGSTDAQGKAIKITVGTDKNVTTIAFSD